MDTTIRDEVAKQNIKFAKMFSDFQAECRRLGNKYIDSEGYQDVKILFDMYSSYYALRGFNTNNLDSKKVDQLLKVFDIYRQKDLVNFLIESLRIKGNLSHAETFHQLLKRKQILCAFKDLKKRKNIFTNLTSFVRDVSSYNLASLVLSLIVSFAIATLIYLPAPVEIMEVISTTKIDIAENSNINHVANVLLYIFDFDDSMTVKPISTAGAVLMVLMRVFIVLIIVNYLIREVIGKIRYDN